MVGAFLPDDAIGRTGRGDRLETFLQFALRIHFLRLGEDPLDEGSKVAEKKVLCRGESSVEVDRAREGFDRVGEIRGTGAPAAGEFAFAEEEVGAESDVIRKKTECLPRDEAAAALCERAFAVAGEAAEQFLGED